MKIVRPSPVHLTVIIEYPSNGGKVVHSAGIKLYRVENNGDEKEITSCGALSVYSDDHGFVWAEAELFADKNGNPLFEGPPLRALGGQTIITKTFTCNVEEIRSASSYTKGYRDAHEHVTGIPLRGQPIKKMRARKAVTA